ncbi:MAG: hypothetical protein ABIO36_10505 [Pyrinomonadaceae bacterium]
MTSIKLKQIGLALCLMASLLLGSASACTCAHHEETKAAETDCRSHRDSTLNAETAETANAADDECICSVDNRSPYAASKSESRELHSRDAVAKPATVIPRIELVSLVTSNLSSKFVSDLSYSYTLRSLLPSRAPPRL